MCDLEGEMLTQINNPHIVKLFYWELNDGFLYSVYEFCQNGSLEEKMKNESIPEDECLKIFFELINAFETLQELSIVHRDVKSESILMKDHIHKLADLGMSQKLNSNGKASRLAGTLKYLALEIAFKSEEYDDKCDIWSLGVVLFRMFYTSFPLDYESIEEYSGGQKK